MCGGGGGDSSVGLTRFKGLNNFHCRERACGGSGGKEAEDMAESPMTLKELVSLIVSSVVNVVRSTKDSWFVNRKRKASRRIYQFPIRSIV